MAPVLHACAFPGCAQRVDATRLACIEHWFLLPDAVRDVLYREYRAAALAGRSLRPGDSGAPPPRRLLALSALAQAHWAGEGARLAGRDDGVEAERGALERAKFQRRLGLESGESDPFDGFELEDVLYDEDAFAS
jgi:hypothetical protein